MAPLAHHPVSPGDLVNFNIWLLTASQDIELTVLHIPGKVNTRADALSRWYGGGLNRNTMNELLRLTWVKVSEESLVLNSHI